MKLNQITKRTLKNVGQNIWNAISVMEARYGAQLDAQSKDVETLRNACLDLSAYNNRSRGK